MKKRASIASLTAAALLWMLVHAHAACDGCVVNAVQSASSPAVNANRSCIAAVLKLLGEIDTKLSSAGSKIADSWVQASHTQREMAVEIQRQAERERVARETELPID